jgi:glycosyltransferase involved in cell wall biosynthesis
VQPLSVTIIARDEADRIAAAIRSVSFADEVLVLDSGSTDDTVAVAESLGARVIVTDWPGYVAQKNRAASEAQHDWVLSIDADERVTPELRQAIAAALGDVGDVAGFEIARLGFWEGEPMRHGTWWPARQVRLFDRRHARFEGRDPHDRVVVDGRTRRLEGALHHLPYRDLSEHLATIERYTALFVAGCLSEGRRAHWWDIAFRPPLHLFKAIVLKAGFLDGVRGLCVAGLGTAHVLLKWGRLYMVQSRASLGP